MPKAYDLDLRRKVIEAITLNGMKRCEVSEQFNISRNSISNWLKRYEATGDIQPSPHNHHGHSHKITDWDAFRAFVEANPDKTQTEMAELWPDEISDRTISRALRKIGFTKKKELWVQTAQ